MDKAALLRGLLIGAVLVAAGSSLSVAVTPGGSPTADSVGVASLCGPGSPVIPDLVDVVADGMAPAGPDDPIGEDPDDSPPRHEAPELEALLPEVVDGIAADKSSSLRPRERDDEEDLYRSLLERAGLERTIERMASADYGRLGYLAATRIDGIPAAEMIEQPGFLSVLRRANRYVPCGIWRIGQNDVLVFGSGDGVPDEGFMSDVVMAMWIEDDVLFGAISDSYSVMARLLGGR